MTELFAKHRRRQDNGFTLIELLVVIVILGVLSAVVVFAVKGVNDEADTNARATDRRIVKTALEAYCATYDRYPQPSDGPPPRDAMDELVDKKFLSNRSDYTKLETGDVSGPEVEGNCNGGRYKLTPINPTNPVGPTPPEWQDAGDMAMGTGRAKAIVLDGPNCGDDCSKVLVISALSIDGPPYEVVVADLYDPRTGTWETAAPPPVVRRGEDIHNTSMVMTSGNCLSNCGKVLLNIYDTFMLYDAASGTWLPTGQPLTDCYLSGNMTALANGKILLVGGGVDNSDTNHPCYTRAELYDPVTGLWLPTTSPDWPHCCGNGNVHMVTLSDGRALITGGRQRPSANVFIYSDRAEIYDPDDASWTETSIEPLTRDAAHLVALASGKVLVIASSQLVTTAKIYNPADGLWTDAAPCAVCLFDRGASLTTLPSGKVLSAGGASFTVGTDSRGRLQVTSFTSSERVEVYDPANDSWTELPPLKAARMRHAAVLLTGTGCADKCGRVLVAAGDNDGMAPPDQWYGESLSSAELSPPL